MYVSDIKSVCKVLLVFNTFVWISSENECDPASERIIITPDHEISCPQGSLVTIECTINKVYPNQLLYILHKNGTNAILKSERTRDSKISIAVKFNETTHNSYATCVIAKDTNDDALCSTYKKVSISTITRDSSDNEYCIINPDGDSSTADIGASTISQGRKDDNSSTTDIGASTISQGRKDDNIVAFLHSSLGIGILTFCALALVLVLMSCYICRCRKKSEEHDKEAKLNYVHLELGASTNRLLKTKDPPYVEILGILKSKS